MDRDRQHPFRLPPRPARALHRPGRRAGAGSGDGERRAGAGRGRYRGHELPGRGVPSGVAAVLQRGVPAAGCERDRGSGAVRPGVQQRGRRLAGVSRRGRQRGRRAAARPVDPRPAGAGRADRAPLPGQRDDADAGRAAGRGIGRRRAGGVGRRVRPGRVLLQHPLHRRAGIPCRVARADVAARNDPGLGDLEPDRGRPVHARETSRSRPADVGAGPGGARRVRAPQPLPGSAGGWRAAGQHRRGDGGQRDDGQDRGLAHRVRAHHAHRGARRDPAARVRLQQRRRPLSERAAGRLRHESRRASRARRHGESG